MSESENLIDIPTEQNILGINDVGAVANLITQKIAESKDENSFISSEVLSSIINSLRRHYNSNNNNNNNNNNNSFHEIQPYDILEIAKCMNVLVENQSIHSEQFLKHPSNILYLILNILNLFDTIDQDGDGKLDQTKMKNLLHSLNFYDSIDKLDTLLSSLDKDNKGYVSFKDFIIYLISFQKNDVYSVSSDEKINEEESSKFTDNISDENVNKQIMDLNQKILTLESQLSIAESAQVSLNEKIKEQNLTIEACKKKIMERKIIEEERNKLREEIENYKYSINEIEEKLKDYQRKEKDIISERDSLKKEVFEKGKELNDSSDILRSMKNKMLEKNDELKQTLERQEEVINSLTEQNKQLEIKLIELKTKNQELEQQYQDLNMLLDGARQEIDSLEQERRLFSTSNPKKQAPGNLMDQLVNLKQKQKTTSEQSQNIQSSLVDSTNIEQNKEVDELNREIERLQQELGNLRIEKDEADKEKQSLLEHLNQLKSTNYESEIELYKEEIDKLKSHIENLEKEKDSLDKESVEDNEMLKMELNKLNDRIKRLNNLLNELENEKKDLLQNIEELESSKSNMENQLALLDSKVQELEEEIERIEGENKEKENQILLIESQKQQLETLLQSKELQISKLQQVGTRANTSDDNTVELEDISLNEEETQKMELEKQYKYLKKKSEDDEKLLNALRKEIEELRAIDEPIYHPEEERNELINKNKKAATCCFCCYF